MTKIKLLAAAVAVASVSSLAGAAAPDAPDVYKDGPLSPITYQTNLSIHERAAYAMLEGILQMTEAKIHADGCAPGTLGLKVYSDAGNLPFASPPVPVKLGTATLGSFGNSVTVEATVSPPSFRGQIVEVDQTPTAGFISATPVENYNGDFAYNAANSMMTGNMTVDVEGANGTLNDFSGMVIKDFYKGDVASGEQYLIYDWGLQSLAKMGYPIEKYWQRSKVRRGDGGIAQIAFIKDRLVGNTKCRIAIALDGTNDPELLWQDGTLTISQVAPGAAVQEFVDIEK